MARRPKGDLITQGGFDYSTLDDAIAKAARTAAQHIRERVTKSLAELVAVGDALLAIKDALPHGQFGVWVRTEFGWTDRTARNFMAVAEQFGKTEMISEMRIEPTAAYLLAAPSIPEEARQAVIDRAEAGERITAKVAKEIVAKSRKKSRKGTSGLSGKKLADRLRSTLDRFRNKWDQSDLVKFIRTLRDFAEQIEAAERAPRRARQ